jgi:tRNA threonylcarbamoyladenosine modification (KEOPS) complex  Pcc1 subunit
VVGPWHADLELSGLGPEESGRLLASLGPEEGRDVPRSEVHLALDARGDLRLSLVAPSTSALRASLNAHLRWIALGSEVGRWTRQRLGAASPASSGVGSNNPAPSPPSRNHEPDHPS